MNRLNDAATVAEQYATETNLEARRALYDEVEGENPQETLWRLLAKRRPRRVLEVGGGPGELAERMQDELEATVAFVDVSPRMVELASARGIDAQVGDVQALQFADGEFDCVVAAWMLYHVPDLERALAEIARVLTSAGALIAVTTSVEHLQELRDLVQYPPGNEEPFNRENGEILLGRHFAQIERHDLDVKVTVRDRAKLVAYQQSMQVPTGSVPEQVQLPFVTYARTTIFVATK